MRPSLLEFLTNKRGEDKSIIKNSPTKGNIKTEPSENVKEMLECIESNASDECKQSEIGDEFLKPAIKRNKRKKIGKGIV